MFVLIMKSILFAIIDINNIITDIRRRKFTKSKQEKANKEMEEKYK